MKRCRDYSPWIVFRVFILVALWVLYGLIPHQLSFVWLNLVTVALVVYAAKLYVHEERFGLGLIVVAILLNNLLFLYLSPLFNLLVTILISVILFFDIVSAPQKV